MMAIKHPSWGHIYDPEQIFGQRRDRWLLFLINSPIVSINVLVPHCVINQESDRDHFGKSQMGTLQWTALSESWKTLMASEWLWDLTNEIQ